MAHFVEAEHGEDSHEVNEAGSFRVRRAIDGTDAQIFRLVTKLLKTFEPKVLAGS